jgi:hypothetical protein
MTVKMIRIVKGFMPGYFNIYLKLIFTIFEIFKTKLHNNDITSIIFPVPPVSSFRL